LLCFGQQDRQGAISIDEMPVPEGGIDAFKSWINENNRFKIITDTVTESDRVYVQFTVDTSGSPKEIVIVRGYEPAYDKEAYRLITSCPVKWKPAMKEGKKVAVKFTMPIPYMHTTAESIKAIEERCKSLVFNANKQIFNEGDLAFAEEVFASYYLGQGPGYIKKRVTALKTAFPDLKVYVHPIVAKGNMVAWRREHVGTHQGEYMGFPPTRKQISWHSTIISQIVDMKIVHEWSSSNLMEVLQKNKISDQ
jgi:predicted ester cyclase